MDAPFTPAVSARWALLLCGLAVGSCNQAGEKPVPCASRDLMVIAARHYRAIASAEALSLGGGKLTYVFEDEGDNWSVMVTPYRDHFMHVVLMKIRKSDRRVSGIEARERSVKL